MSDSSPSHQPLQQQEETHEPDPNPSNQPDPPPNKPDPVTTEDKNSPQQQEEDEDDGGDDDEEVEEEVEQSQEQQNPSNQPDPPPNKPDPVTTEDKNSPQQEEEEEEEDEDDGGDDDEEGEEEVEQSQEQQNPSAVSPGMPLRIDPPITGPHVSVRDVTLASPSNARANRRKKGKGKFHAKKRQAIEEKTQSLRAKLKAIPFTPNKILDFDLYEKLLKKLGLWDFAHIDLDRSIRVDLTAQLIATYQPKLRASYVNGVRIMVNRADLARAFRLPLKKEKGNVEVDLEWEVFSVDEIGFMVNFLLDWVLLHADMWMMPKEVADWMNVIKDGHPEKVDWAGVLWFMVEKELKQGGQLTHCYYASHLQHLIKFQHEELLLVEEEAASKEEEDGVDAGEEGPSTKLTLGQDDDDDEKEDGINGVEMMDVEKQNDSGGDDDDEEGKQRHWLLDGKNNLGEHFMQRCGADNASEDKRDEEEVEMDGEEDDVEEDEAGNNENFHVLPNGDGLEGDGFTGNLLEAMEGNQMAFSLQDDDMHHIASITPPFFNNNRGKRVVEHDDHILHHSGNKRLRINDPWDNNNDNKPVDFGMCMGQIQQITERARVFYEEKEQALAQSNLNQQILLTELQKRDAVIEHLHKARMDEVQKKDAEILRLERELFLVGSVVEGYRKALKGTQKTFAEYREKAKLHEESTYKDSGCGGLMLTTVELENLRKKQEEQYKEQCAIVELCNKTEQHFGRLFDEHVEKVNLLEERFRGVESYAKEVIGLCANKKVPKIAEQVPEAKESLPTPQPEEKVLEGVEEPLTMAETEDKEREVVEKPQTIAETADEEREVVEEPQTIAETAEKEREVVEEPQTIAETADKEREEVEEPQTIAETADKEREVVEEPRTIAETKEQVPEVVAASQPNE